jgi:PAS domain S-box-containing protein
VANNINDLVALYSPEGMLEYLSPSVSKLLGYDAESLIGSSPNKFVHPSDRHFLEIGENDYRDKKIGGISFEYRLLHKNGHWVYFDSYWQPIFDDADNLMNVLAVCRDISKRKTAEQALLESEELYRRLADNILDLVVILKPDGTRVYVSPSSFTLFGYTPEELTGNHFSDIVHPDDAKKIRNEVLEKVFLGQDKILVELRILHKNGQMLFCETNLKALRDKDGKLSGFVSTTRDITEWKLTQIALRESEEKYRSLVESSDAMISMVNRKNEFIFVNDKRAAFFETTKEKIIGKTAYAFYSGEKARVFNERIQMVFEKKAKFVFEDQAVLNNKDYWLRATLLPVFDSTGQVHAVMLSTIDITVIKHSEDALRKQNEELKQIAFLQSHIVRSPLTNIQGILYLINEGALDDENRYYFQLLKQAAEKLDDIIKEIVDRAVFVRRQTMDEK